MEDPYEAGQESEPEKGTEHNVRAEAAGRWRLVGTAGAELTTGECLNALRGEIPEERDGEIEDGDDCSEYTERKGNAGNVQESEVDGGNPERSCGYE